MNGNRSVDLDWNGVARRRAWLVLVLTFGLMMSDFMSRQVLSAVMPAIKSEWHLSDAMLGLLNGVVPLMVGLLTLPLSFVADRWGRVRSLVSMAVLWSLATLVCGLAADAGQMLAARAFVGIGQAVCGSVGLAIALSYFPVRLRATVTGVFMSSALYGSVVGVAAGGVIASQFGWRWSFVAMGVFGLLIAAIFPRVVKERASSEPLAPPEPAGMRALFTTPSLVFAYIGSGLQLVIIASLIAWLPSYLHRYHGMPADRAALASAVLLLVSALGMPVCGYLCDRLQRTLRYRPSTIAVAFCLLSFVLLWAAFRTPPEAWLAQFLLLGLGVFVATGITGPTGAIVAGLAPQKYHGTAFAVLTLANNLTGLALGPVVTGALADSIGLSRALGFIPAFGLLAAAMFFISRRHFARDERRAGDIRLGAT